MGDIFLGNIKGEKGDTGAGLKILDCYATEDELFTAVPTPSVGDAYGVGSNQQYEIYIYTQSKGWVNTGILQPDINEQVPNYAEATTLEALTGDEKISLAFGKIKKAITDLISHLSNKSNPHNVTASQVSALPSTGGTMSGDLTMYKEGTPVIYFKTNKSSSRIMKNASNTSDGGLLLTDFADIDDGDNYVHLKLCHARTLVAPNEALQILIAQNGERVYKNIFGEHNKPRSTYVGNGSSTQRTIPIGGISNILYLTSSYGWCLVTAHGAMAITGTGNNVFGHLDIKYKDGNLTISSASDYFNKDGTIYTYQVL